MLYTATYRRPSQVLVVGSLVHVFLSAMQRKEPAARPWLFHGQLAAPILFRDCLLTLRDVVNARFYRPDLWRLLDPVVTIEPDWVRLEAFSSDAGVYARVDFSPDAFHEGEMGSPGTTNVDFGSEFAARLSRLRAGKDSAFEVGEESVTLHSEGGDAVERKVELPERWIRGFLQIQAIQRAARPRFALNQVDARRALSAVPSTSPSGTTLFVNDSGRVSPMDTGSAANRVEVGGLHRLRLLRRIAPHVAGLYVWAVDDCAPTFWMADLGSARVSLGLSSAIQQGFSGDGEALKSARHELDDSLIGRAREVVKAQTRFDVAELAQRLSVNEAVAGELIDLLSQQGLLGYDLPEQKFYPRHLPYTAASGFTAQPRDVNSKRLVGEGKVELESRMPTTSGEELVGWVEGEHATYHVRVNVNPEGSILDGDCTCPWHLKHQMQRGPCKHILALRLAGQS